MTRVLCLIGVVRRFRWCPRNVSRNHIRLMRGWRPAPSRRSRTSKSLTCVQGLALSLALAAELNGYPGPRHTVGLAKELDLNADQRDRIEALFAAMTAESIAIGEKLIAQETARPPVC